MRRPGANGKPGVQPLRCLRAHGRRAQRLQHQSRRHHLLGQRGRERARSRAPVREKWGKYKLGLALRRCGSSARRPASTATGTTTSSSTTSRAPSTATAIYAPVSRRSATTPPVTYAVRDGPLPDVPLGEAPRALLPRRALVPQRRRRRRCATATSRRPRRRPCATRSRRSRRVSATPFRRPASLRSTIRARTMLGARQYAAFTKGDPGVEGDLEGHRQRGPDPAVLRAPVRPLGGVRGRARAAPALPAGERAERRLPDDRHAREPRQRGALQDARRAARELRDLGGRDRPGRDEHVREGDRRASSAHRARGQRSARSSSSRRRRTGWACAARRSTRTATRR